MGLTLKEIIKASEMITSHAPSEQVVVLGLSAYTLLNHHVKSVFITAENKFINKMNGIECHVSFALPKMNYMILSREQYIKFKEKEKEFLDQFQPKQK